MLTIGEKLLYNAIKYSTLTLREVVIGILGDMLSGYKTNRTEVGIL